MKMEEELVLSHKEPFQQAKNSTKIISLFAECLLASGTVTQASDDSTLFLRAVMSLLRCIERMT